MFPTLRRPDRTEFEDARNVTIAASAQPTSSDRVEYMSVIDKTVVTLRFFGDELDPDEITALLCHPPSAGHRKGGTWTTKRGVEKIARTGSWRLEVSDRQPGDLDGQIEEIFGLLSDDLSVWKDLATRFKADVFCGLFMSGSNERLVLSPSTMERLGSRGLMLDLDIYDGGTPD